MLNIMKPCFSKLFCQALDLCHFLGSTLAGGNLLSSAFNDSPLQFALLVTHFYI